MFCVVVGRLYTSYKVIIKIGGKVPKDGVSKGFRVVLDDLKINTRGSNNLEYYPELRIK